VPCAVVAGARQTAGVSIKVKDETVPPGGMVQVKVVVTEPQPISTGKGRITRSFGTLAGFALHSPGNDAYGVAVVDAAGLDVSVRSPASTFGTSLDYPVLTVTERVPATTPLGVAFPVDIEAATLRLLDPSGAVYPTEVAGGVVTTRAGLSIHDVVPGSAALPAGAVVTIMGSGFQPRTRVRFNETKLASVRFVDSGKIVVVLAQATVMHGKRIRAEDPDGSRVEYYSYQRVRRVSPSTRAVLASAVPLFPQRFVADTVIVAAGMSTGVAVQNQHFVSASVRMDLSRPDGSFVKSIAFTLASTSFLIRDISEVFGVSYQPGSRVRIRSTLALQSMGVAVDAAGDAAPILPR
jgi:hypothetical protein